MKLEMRVKANTLSCIGSLAECHKGKIAVLEGYRGREDDPNVPSFIEGTIAKHRAEQERARVREGRRAW